MKNISRLFYSLVEAFVMVVVLSLNCYADVKTTKVRIKLPASESDVKPTIYIREGKSDTQYSITTEGILAGDKLVTILQHDPKYMEWSRGLLKQLKIDHTLTEDQYWELERLSETTVHIAGYCGEVDLYSKASLSKAVRLSDVGATLTCEKGEKLAVEQYNPSKQDEDGANKKGVLLLTIKQDI